MQTAEPCISYDRDVRLSVTRWHWVKTAQARITKSSTTNSPRTLVLAKKVEPEIPKGSPLVMALNESWVKKLRFSANNAVSQKRCKIRPKLLLMTNRKSHTPFRLVPNSTTLNDLERPIRTLFQKRCVFRSPPQKFEWRQTHQQQKCRPMTLVSDGIRFMRIRFLGEGASNDSGVVDNGNFQRFRWLFFGYFRDEASVMQCVVGFSVNPKSGLAGWDHATSKNNYVKTNKDSHILSAVQIFGMDSSFWRYMVCADIRSGCLERRR